MSRGVPYLRLAFLTLIVLGGYTFYREALSDKLPYSARKGLYSIAPACYTYAQAHDGNFPDGKSSNEALRKLFQTGVERDELSYGWPSYGKRPDEKIGNAENGFRQALEEGECNLYFVRGLKQDRADPQPPLLFRLVEGDFELFWVAIRHGGAAMLFSAGDDGVSGEFESKPINLLSPDYWKQFNIDFKDVLAPEGPPPNFATLTAKVKANRRNFTLLQGAMIALILLFIGLFIREVRTNRRKDSASCNDVS